MQAKRTVISSLMTSLALATVFVVAPPSEAAQKITSQLPPPGAAGIAPFPDVCPDQDMVLRPQSDFPDTAIGRVRFMLQSRKMQYSVLCLVDKARAKAGLQEVHSYVALGKNYRGPRGLSGSAYDHARAAAQLRWWGTVSQYPTCTPRKDDPRTAEDESLKCDPHINPQTKSTPAQRAQEQGFAKNCTKWKVGENAYTATSASDATPRAAFGWWWRSQAHHDTMMDPEYNTMQLAVVAGSADPAGGTNAPAATFVQEFGRCWS
ncbi:CAP domain-containing protein [Streptomyces cellulosae]|uniref:hypothetical protein n=1 Tax=Streptomyces cellulosae TaxID=1968 RepID=UPI00131BC7C0|nr:hypothetical protein [Streptomyces cellulosae]